MANYESALRDIDNPLSQDYKPFPVPIGLLPGFIQQNRDFLQARVDYWNGVKGNGASSKERANIDKIIAALNTKIAGYDKALSDALSSTPDPGSLDTSTTADDLAYADTNTPTGTGSVATGVGNGVNANATAKKTNLTPFIIGGVALLVIITTIIVIKRRKK